MIILLHFYNTQIQEKYYLVLQHFLWKKLQTSCLNKLELSLQRNLKIIRRQGKS
jgi:hypothetical protein